MPLQVEDGGVAFMVHWTDKMDGDMIRLKLTAKPKALDKSFSKVIVEPFLKSINAARPADDQLSLDNLEKVLIGPGDRLSDRIPDLSASVRSVVPSDVVPSGVARVDLIPRRERNVSLALAGVQLEATLPADFVHLPMRQSILPEFLSNLNKAYKLNLTLDDIAAVKSTINLNQEMVSDEVDMSRPAFEVLPRAGKTKLEVVLREALVAEVVAKLPKLGVDPNKGAAVFRVRCGEVELKLTLQAKGLSKSLRDGVITPFLQACAKRTHIPNLSADQVRRIEVDGMAVSDGVTASSFVSGTGSGAPVVRVDIFLPDTPPAATPSALLEPPQPTEVAGELTAMGGVSLTGTDAAPSSKPAVHRSSADYYKKWASFDDLDGSEPKTDPEGLSRREGRLDIRPLILPKSF